MCSGCLWGMGACKAGCMVEALVADCCLLHGEWAAWARELVFEYAEAAADVADAAVACRDMYAAGDGGAAAAGGDAAALRRWLGAVRRLQPSYCRPRILWHQSCCGGAAGLRKAAGVTHGSPGCAGRECEPQTSRTRQAVITPVKTWSRETNYLFQRPRKGALRFSGATESTGVVVCPQNRTDGPTTAAVSIWGHDSRVCVAQASRRPQNASWVSPAPH